MRNHCVRTHLDDGMQRLSKVVRGWTRAYSIRCNSC